MTAPEPPPIHVGEATPDDHAAIGELTVRAYTALAGRPHLAQYDEHLRDVAARATEGVVLVATDADGRPTAALTCVEPAEIPGFPGHTQFRHFAVDPDDQGSGAAALLLDEVAARARQAGRSGIVLHTADYMAAAIRLYVRMGYRRRPEHDEGQADGPTLRCYELVL